LRAFIFKYRLILFQLILRLIRCQKVVQKLVNLNKNIILKIKITKIIIKKQIKEINKQFVNVKRIIKNQISIKKHMILNKKNKISKLIGKKIKIVIEVIAIKARLN